MNLDFKKHIIQMLATSRELIAKNPYMIDETGDINTKGQKTITIDKAIEDAFLDYLKDSGLPVTVFSEEIGEVKIHPKSEYYISFDPLDGSTNYTVGKNLFPYGTLIAVYQGTQPKLSDVIAAGAIEYTHTLGWLYHDGKTTDLNDNPVFLKTDWPISKSSPLYLDLYYPEGYQAYSPLAGQFYIRNSGSTMGNLAYVLNNSACGLGHPAIKAEEIGAVYALVKGAGGIVMDHSGKDLGMIPFSTEKKLQLLAGCKNTIKYALERMNP